MAGGFAASTGLKNLTSPPTLTFDDPDIVWTPEWFHLWVFLTAATFSITVNHIRDCSTRLIIHLSFFYIYKKALICFFLCVLAHVTRTTVVGETLVQTISLSRDFWAMLYRRLQVLSLFGFPRVYILHRCFISAFRSN
jgi:hypothetical protein